MAPIAYLTPFRNAENAYIERQKALLSELGFEVRPLSISALLRGRCSGLFSRRNVVLVHWLENRVFKVGVLARGVSLIGAPSFLSYLILLGAARARVVYFVHDHAVHDVKPRYSALSTALIATLRSLADSRVVHDPSAVDRYAATYLPHPLYSAREPSSTPAVTRVTDHPLRYAIMGSLRPYKGIDGLLWEWPRGTQLLIAGKGDPAYIALLARVIKQRGLAEWVTLDPRFLPETEFSEKLSTQDVLILPHLPNANLVSGAFFEAIGVVKVILARRTPFLAWAKTRFPNVFCFESDHEIPSKLAEIAAAWPQLRALDSMSSAEDEFGRSACREAYGRFLGCRPERIAAAPPRLHAGRKGVPTEA